MNGARMVRDGSGVEIWGQGDERLGLAMAGESSTKVALMAQRTLQRFVVCREPQELRKAQELAPARGVVTIAQGPKAFAGGGNTLPLLCPSPHPNPGRS